MLTIAKSAAGIFGANMNGQGVYAGQVVHVHADGSQDIVNAADLGLGGQYAPNPVDLGRLTTWFLQWIRRIRREVYLKYLFKKKKEGLELRTRRRPYETRPSGRFAVRRSVGYYRAAKRRLGPLKPTCRLRLLSSYASNPSRD